MNVEGGRGIRKWVGEGHQAGRCGCLLQIIPKVTELIGSSYRYHRAEVGWRDAELVVVMWGSSSSSCLTLWGFHRAEGSAGPQQGGQLCPCSLLLWEGLGDPIGWQAPVPTSPLPGLRVHCSGWVKAPLLCSQNLEYCIMVIGVPNVGKSSLINSLRRQHLRIGMLIARGAC
jgi:hypothetical protein